MCVCGSLCPFLGAGCCKSRQLYLAVFDYTDGAVVDSMGRIVLGRGDDELKRKVVNRISK